MDNSTVKEICDVVTAEVMKQVQANLSAIKPQLFDEIQNSVVTPAINETLKIDDKKSNIIERRISQLEKDNKAEKSNYQSSILALENRIAQLEAKIDKITAKPVNPQQEKGKESSDEFKGITNLPRPQMAKILSFPAYYCKYNGWIYYIKKAHSDNYNEYGYLYKVKTDGSENQRIFNEKVAYGLGQFGFCVTENVISFHDFDGNLREIPLESELKRVKTDSTASKSSPEKSTTSSNPSPTPKTPTKHIETKKTPSSTSRKTNNLSAKQLDKILSFPYYYRKDGDWIYYFKRKVAFHGKIYKVRCDGTQNQRIFNELVTDYTSDTLSIKGNVLYYHDFWGTPRTINIK